jgi:hypothetical protein
MEVVIYEVLTSTTSPSPAELQESVSRHGGDARVEHSYWARCSTGWRGVLFLAGGASPDEKTRPPACSGGVDPHGERRARAIEAAFLALCPHAVLTVVRADPPR